LPRYEYNSGFKLRQLLANTLIKCINSNNLSTASTWEALFDKTVSLGFSGLELTCPPATESNIGLTQPHCAELVDIAKMRSLQIPALTTDKFDLFSLANTNDQQRTAAIEYLENLIETATWFGPQVIFTISAHALQPLAASLQWPYEQSFNNVFTALAQLTERAEELGVYLAFENPAAALLLSPLELRDLIDELNSPFLGSCYNPAHTAHLGDPTDWLRILANRVFVVRLAYDKTVETPGIFDEAIVEELKRFTFDGPIVYK